MLLRFPSIKSSKKANLPVVRAFSTTRRGEKAFSWPIPLLTSLSGPMIYHQVLEHKTTSGEHHKLKPFISFHFIAKEKQYFMTLHSLFFFTSGPTVHASSKATTIVFDAENMSGHTMAVSSEKGLLTAIVIFFAYTVLLMFGLFKDSVPSFFS